MIAQKRMGRLLFMVEIFVFAIVYLFGTHGIQAIVRLRQEDTQLQEDVQILEKEVKQLAHNLETWQNNPYYKEKIAREQLQMAQKNELIYYF